MLLLLGGAQLLLPEWLRMFVEGIGQYRQYTHGQSALSDLFGRVVGRILWVACVLTCAFYLWTLRRKPASSAEFGQAVGLLMALTVVVVPISVFYNQILLAPAILALLRSESVGDRILPAVRRARAIGYLLVVWSWFATMGLSLAFLWLTPEMRQQVWPIPFYSSYMMPVSVFGLALLDGLVTLPSDPIGRAA